MPPVHAAASEQPSMGTSAEPSSGCTQLRVKEPGRPLLIVRHCRRTCDLRTVIETDAFLWAADHLGMSDEEPTAVVDLIASDPTAGAVMPGTGGCRKLRVSKPGRGKSGGYRVITFFGGTDIPVFMLTVFGKNEKANLTRAERNALCKLTKTLKAGARANEERIRQDRRGS